MSSKWLSFRELCDSKLPGLCTRDNLVTSVCQKRGKNQKGRMAIYEIPILEVIFVTLTMISSVITNDTQGLLEYPDRLK